MLLRNLPDKLVDLRNRLHHNLPQKRLSKPLRPGIRTRINPFLLQQIQIQRKRPFTIRPTLDAQEPLVRERIGQCPLNILPSTDVAVVHEHQRLVLERVAVVIRERALGCGAHVCKDEIRAGLGCEAFKVLAVPGGKGRREDAWFGAEFGVCVEAYSEAIAVYWTAVIEPQTGIVGLRED